MRNLIVSSQQSEHDYTGPVHYINNNDRYFRNIVDKTDIYS